MKCCSRIFIFVALLFVSFCATGTGFAATMYSVGGGGGQATINEWGVCQIVTNNNGTTIMVPTNTAAEWSNFRSNAPGVALSGCNCTGTPWGTVANGFSGTAYASSSVACGSSCSGQTRTCTNGSMSGSYAYTSCSVNACANCTGTPWGTVASGFSGTAYSTTLLSTGYSCSSYAQTRTCFNGSMSGSYPYTSCSVCSNGVASGGACFSYYIDFACGSDSFYHCTRNGAAYGDYCQHCTYDGVCNNGPAAVNSCISKYTTCSPSNVYMGTVASAPGCLITCLGGYTFNKFTRACDEPPPVVCLLPGTMVRMVDGTEKTIETVEVGEVVIGQDGAHNTVLALDRHPLGARHTYAFNGGRYFVTEDHPFMTTEGWKSIDPALTAMSTDMPVSRLQVGDILVTEQGNVVIKTIENRDDDDGMTVYNFILDGNRTYYGDGYLVKAYNDK